MLHICADQRSQIMFVEVHNLGQIMYLWRPEQKQGHSLINVRLQCAADYVHHFFDAIHTKWDLSNGPRKAFLRDTGDQPLLTPSSYQNACLLVRYG